MDRLLTSRDLEEAGLGCRQTIWRLVNKYGFPRPFRFNGDGDLRWRESEVEAFIERCRIGDPALRPLTETIVDAVMDATREIACKAAAEAFGRYIKDHPEIVERWLAEDEPHHP